MSSARRERRLGLGLRLSLWYFGVFFASTVLLASVAGMRIRSSIHEKIVETVTSSLHQNKLAFEASGIDGLKQIAESPDGVHRPLYVRLLGGDDTTIFEHSPSPALSFESMRRAPTDHVQRVHADNDGSEWSLGTTTLADGQRLQLAISDDQTREVVGHLRAGLLAVWIGAVTLGLLGGLLITQRALRPVQTLAATARHVIASGNLALRVPERGTRDELDELSQLFNGVLARNESLVRGMRDALDNVAHDLRTPLTRLRTGAEVALRAPDDGGIREALADTLEESERVLSMLTTLMDISEAETGIMKLDRTSVDLGALAREGIELYQHVADERGVRLQSHVGGPVRTNGDAGRLRQAVANLIDNAVKYTPAGGIVEVGTAREGADAILSVTDSGQGISAADLPRIWDRLYRGDRSRSEAGLGLGLSLVKAVIEAHKGRLDVQSEPGRGSTFTVVLAAE